MRQTLRTEEFTVGDLVIPSGSMSSLYMLDLLTDELILGVVLAALQNRGADHRHYTVWFPAVNKIVSRVLSHEIRMA